MDSDAEEEREDEMEFAQRDVVDNLPYDGVRPRGTFGLARLVQEIVDIDEQYARDGDSADNVNRYDAVRRRRRLRAIRALLGSLGRLYVCHAGPQ